MNFAFVFIPKFLFAVQTDNYLEHFLIACSTDLLLYFKHLSDFCKQLFVPEKKLICPKLKFKNGLHYLDWRFRHPPSLPTTLLLMLLCVGMIVTQHKKIISIGNGPSSQDSRRHTEINLRSIISNI
jgi:hypothetical protein